jgi:hypothetical protein
MRQLFYLLLLLSIPSFSQEIALVKYSGGGDWYANPTSLPNLIKYCNANINTRIKQNQQRLNPVVLIYFHTHSYDWAWKCSFNDADSNNLKLFTRWRFSSY